jgi:hypothetical protein
MSNANIQNIKTVGLDLYAPTPPPSLLAESTSRQISNSSQCKVEGIDGSERFSEKCVLGRGKDSYLLIPQ